MQACDYLSVLAPGYLHAMSIEDLRDIDTELPIETDLCIVGSGPAGWTIAEELRDRRLRILMLESGGVEREVESQALNAIESLGAPVLNGRERTLGGTSCVWYGRCISLDDIDYEAREWVPMSGWPFRSETIAHYLDRASGYLGVGACRPVGRGPAPHGPSKRPEVDTSLLHHVCWDDTAPVDFGRLILARRNANLRVLLHATVTHLNTDPTGMHLESVEIASSRDKRTTVRARAVVLCAGGVENARILLYSNRLSQSGVGNGHDVVGRYFMDHPRDLELIVRFDTSDAARVRSLFGPYKLDSMRRRYEFAYGLALSPELQRREGLLNCAAWPHEVAAPDDPLLAAKRLVAGPRTRVARDARFVMSEPGILMRGLQARLANQRVRHKIDRIGFLIASEQVPDRESRIRLSERRDRLGLPISQINWRIGPQEKASQAVLAKTIASEFQRLGLPRAHLAEWVRDGYNEEAIFVDGCHPIGTTRMADNPRYGVVNSECQVHGVEGLYVAGSSVFPTGGHANPTLMIVALAVRLANRLSEQLSNCANFQVAGGNSSKASAEDRPRRDEAAEISHASSRNQKDGEEYSPVSASAPAVSPGTRVAVTGATGFIGGRLVERLVDQGADVICLTRGSAARSRPLPAGATIRTLEVTESEPLRAALDGVDFVFHCAYDWEDQSWNIRALRSLIEACRAAGCRGLVHLSSFVVYELPASGKLTEDSAEIRSKIGYAHTKLELEGELLRAAREDALPATILQPTIVYGPFSRPWTDAPADMLRYGTVVLPDARDGICNAVYVDDVVSAMILAATHPKAAGERFLISGPRPITWAQFYEEMARAVGAKGPQYQPAEAITRQSGMFRKVFQFAMDPQRVIRRFSQTRLGGKVMTACLRALPRGIREGVRRRLRVPHTRRRGYVHMPSLGIVQSRATASSDKARRVIGYEPQYDFAEGMVATSRYLGEYVMLDPPVG